MFRAPHLLACVTVAAFAAIPACSSAPAATATSPAPAAAPTSTFTAFQEKSLEGKPVPFTEFAGKVVLVVNVASRCGYTPQYEGLEALYKRHEKDGFVILGFPCDQFGNQEPGTEEEIKSFCNLKYGVTFPMFAKVKVNGPEANDLYTYLRKEQPGTFDEHTPGAEKLYSHLKESMPEVLGTDAVKWNFTKFLVDRQGHVVHRFESPETPEAIDATIRETIAKK